MTSGVAMTMPVTLTMTQFLKGHGGKRGEEARGERKGGASSAPTAWAGID